MIHVFLPAYNEEAALEKLVRKFDDEFKRVHEPYRVVVLDDGSTDRTAAVAEGLAQRFPLELLRHSTNRGLGATLRDGLEYVAGTAGREDTVVTLDCDDTHEPRYAVNALSKLREGYDMVILSRFSRGGGEEGLSFLRSFCSRGAGLFLKLFFPIQGVREYSCGYRVCRAGSLQKVIQAFGRDWVRLGRWGFVVCPEILVRFRMVGSRIAEVPFVLRYDQKAGKSKNKPLRTIAGYFALVWLYWGRRGVAP